MTAEAPAAAALLEADLLQLGIAIAYAPEDIRDAARLALYRLHQAAQQLATSEREREALLARAEAINAAWLQAVDEAHQQTDAGLMVSYRASNRIRCRAKELIAAIAQGKGD